MEALTRLVTDSLARHGFDHPVDPRRLQWSRWFRCDSPHSLLAVPSKPGIFALAEDVGVARAPSPAALTATETRSAPLGGTALQPCESAPVKDAAPAAELPARRMLAVLQFSEDDDMAFTLDRMFTRANPMRTRLSSGSCFVRFVVLEDAVQRRSICAALNQWMQSSSEKSTGLPAGFSSSLEITTARVGTPRVGRTLLSDNDDTLGAAPRQLQTPFGAANLDSGANKNLHCPQPFPSGF